MAEFVADGEAVVEAVIERICGMGRIENQNGVASPNLEVLGKVVTSTVAEDVAEGIDGECDAVVGGSVVIGFPQVDLADGGAAGNDVGREINIAGPGLGIGIVGEVGIAAANRAIGRRDEDGSAGEGKILVEARSGH